MNLGTDDYLVHTVVLCSAGRGASSTVLFTHTRRVGVVVDLDTFFDCLMSVGCLLKQVWGGGAAPFVQAGDNNNTSARWKKGDTCYKSQRRNGEQGRI